MEDFSDDKPLKVEDVAWDEDERSLKAVSEHSASQSSEQEEPEPSAEAAEESSVCMSDVVTRRKQKDQRAEKRKAEAQRQKQE